MALCRLLDFLLLFLQLFPQLSRNLQKLQPVPAVFQLKLQTAALPGLRRGFFKQSLPLCQQRQKLFELFFLYGQLPFLLSAFLEVHQKPVLLPDFFIQGFYLTVKFFQPGLMLLTEFTQKRKPLSNPAVKLLLFQLCKLHPAGRILPAEDAVHVLVDAAPQLLVLLPLFPLRRFQHPLQPLIQPGAEDLTENSAALLRPCQQQLLKISLGNHGNLGKLLSVQTDQLGKNPGYLLCLRHRRPFVRESKLRVRPLQGHSRPPAFGPQIFRVPFDRIALCPVLENKFHKSRRLFLCIFAAEHVRPAHLPAGFSIESKHNGVKNRGFPGPGIAGNQVNPGSSQAFKINFRPARIGAKCTYHKPDWFHFPSWLSPLQISIIFFANSICSSFMG